MYHCIVNINLNEEIDMNDTKDDMIEISKKEYKDLKEDSSFLKFLKQYGVFNWDGYNNACDEWYSDACDDRHRNKK